MEIKNFSFSDFIQSGECFHLARTTVYNKQDISLHNHDYAEIFWVEEGSGYHLINGQKIELVPGHLLLIRPSDTHAFLAGKNGLTIMNFAFAVETLQFFKTRYFNDSDAYFWTLDQQPFSILLEMETIKKITKRAEHYGMSCRSNLYGDSLLLSILRFIKIHEQSYFDANHIPGWLSHAVQHYTGPAYFKMGIQGFVDLCQRNADHVNRSVRKCYGVTLTELVNKARMNYAAVQLSLTNVPIKIIAQNCGINTLSHFYNQFNHFHHQSPSAYRKNTQLIV
ncbi:helix-turn-helix domain-containing protein [Sphingobacterium sp. SG20118]|uniref:helix-turn-helix domain-containing protein n=1 Tax=Sphingobacterium sp. SG20118 TaxID=3367156 RepID=UPI0037DFC6A5